MPVNTICFHSHVGQQFDQEIYINNIGNVADGDFAGSKQNCTDDLQGFILRSLGNDLTL